MKVCGIYWKSPPAAPPLPPPLLSLPPPSLLALSSSLPRPPLRTLSPLNLGGPGPLKASASWGLLARQNPFHSGGLRTRGYRRADGRDPRVRVEVMIIGTSSCRFVFVFESFVVDGALRIID